MNVYLVTPPTPEPNIELSPNGELIVLGIMAVAVIGFFGLAWKVLSDEEIKPKRKYRLY